VSIAKLDRRGRVEEIARMLTGAEITDSARRHARENLNSGSARLRNTKKTSTGWKLMALIKNQCSRNHPKRARNNTI
jgi:hypothetical protein